MFAEPMPEGMTWQSELHAVLADDEHTVALIKNTVVRNGETIQNRRGAGLPHRERQGNRGVDHVG